MVLINANEPQQAEPNNEEVDQAFTQTPEENTAEENTSSGSQSNGNEESQEVNQAVAQTSAQDILNGTSNTAIKGNSDEKPDSRDSSDSDSDDQSDGHGDEEHNEDGSGSSEVKQNGRFFTLPYEIRLIIYGNLLRANGGIIQDKNEDRGPTHEPYVPDVQDLHPQILATCRQINAECGNMLYDNIFRLTTADFDRHFHQCRFEDKRYGCKVDLSIPPPRVFKRMRRIELEIGFGRCVHGLDEAVENTVRTLAHMPELQYLSIPILPEVAKNMKADRDDAPFRERDFHRSIVLGLTMVRNVPKVNIEGVAPKWREYLIKKMASSSPIPKMYWLLELYIKQIESHCLIDHAFSGAIRDNRKYMWDRANDIFDINSALYHAFRAAAQDNLKIFTAKREKVLEAVERHLQRAREHVFDHDVVPQKTKD